MLNKYKATPTYYEYVIFNFLHRDYFDTFIDIGVGPKTEYLVIQNKYPNVDFYGVEANPETFKKIKNIFPGKIDNFAISKSKRKAELCIHENNFMASGLIPYDREKNFCPKITIDSITLDDYFLKIGKPKNCLLWMDIEGYELNALQSGRGMLKSGKVSLLNLEVRNRWNGKSGACIESEVDSFLLNFGYKKIFSYNHYPSSRHHDSIYLLDGITIPESGLALSKFFYQCLEKTKTDEGISDLLYGLIDASISLNEKNDKINYLRSKM